MSPRPRPADLRDAPFSYPEVGATSGPLPPGYRHLVRHRPLAPDTFERAADTVLSWRMHRRAGLRVDAEHPTARAGDVVVLRLGAGPLAVTAPCRVVTVFDEADRRGFTYGTLPGHPECGEESFVVARDAAGNVTVTITAFSRPARAITRLAGPLGHLAQSLITDRYLRAVAAR